MQAPSKILKSKVLIQMPLESIETKQEREELETLIHSVFNSIEDSISKYGVVITTMVLFVHPDKITASMTFAAGDFKTSRSFTASPRDHPARTLGQKTLTFLRSMSESWG